MTAEALALERGDDAAAAKFAAEKAKGQEALKALSARYSKVMRDLREEQSAAQA